MGEDEFPEGQSPRLLRHNRFMKSRIIGELWMAGWPRWLQIAVVGATGLFLAWVYFTGG
ncbi:MAG: hypothetical protein QGI63_03285 [Rhodospirillales bacterium]|jgi:hypothetical protein|nr:hypothetical protein [Rhodospirillales bacterium]MDP6773271.1 hypothetical protein [Rhodospirillales bacterium]